MCLARMVPIAHPWGWQPINSIVFYSALGVSAKTLKGDFDSIFEVN